MIDLILSGVWLFIALLAGINQNWHDTILYVLIAFLYLRIATLEADRG